MIEDLDGADRSPSRARALTAVSVLLALGAIVAYGAMSSPLMRGPYATPDPSGGPAREFLSKARYTPAPLASIDPAAFIGRPGQGSTWCVAPNAVFSTVVFIGGRQVVFAQPVSRNTNSTCTVGWFELLMPLPLERFAP